MLGKTAPYQVCMLTATSTDAGAVTPTSKPYRAGSGAVITYWAEERPLARARFAACGRPMTLWLALAGAGAARAGGAGQGEQAAQGVAREVAPHGDSLAIQRHFVLM